ncbi:MULTISPECIES: DUF1810 domain-containing protein [unclassified Sphingobium]|uniref:DUF1810 domain-containing protein n=1 Tax=unclassified Sphingobium TaxID=2611147 RepID=UPI00222414B5|nr:MULTISPECIES: DUF1810 domain-containing protein [unclassified Sphingobium]MCW2382978.1 uncharacterized protein (DUF1810 family) [Sphingobium sp. B2D3B]MCW2400046.1 uncharacterized protein (DUF1810 family) [Sphingobium sp. B2D3C]
MTSDPFDLNRFVDAQQGRYAQALAEIRGGAKRTHWMWFIFPQIAGLGISPTAQHFAIRSRAEAKAYLSHPVLGPRYEECVIALQELDGSSAEQVFGTIDAIKLRSSLTLFNSVEDRPIFRAAIERWFGSPDERTVEILGQMDSSA